MKSIIIYTTTSCPFSGRLRALLSRHGFDYVDRNVSDDPAEAHEMASKSGQLGVPVIDIDGRIIVGFQKEQICDLLEIDDTE